MKAIVTSKKLSSPVLICIALLISLACFGTFRDLVYSSLTGTGFYWSESLIFQNFWWWLLPNFLIYSHTLRRNLLNRQNWFFAILLVIALTTLQLGLHVATFMLFGEITGYPFRFVTIYSSVLDEFALIGLLVNSALLGYLFVSKKVEKSSSGNITKLTVRTGAKQFEINVDVISFFQKDETYVRVHTENSSYLINETLKELIEKLDGSKFARIHKSCVVNRDFVKFTRSRKNGDYDLVLHNKQELRLSRRYRVHYFA